ncbi:MAG: hypothetical protein II842_19465 [Butyrivibrio sp.]|nr:hypothetical protein [Butyrivibrio sp.]
MSLRKRFIIIIYILSVTISVFIFASIVEKQNVTIVYTAFSNCRESDGHIYFSQNMKGKGLLFDLTYKGNVSRIFSTAPYGNSAISGISTNGENIYVVITSFIEKETEDGITSSKAYKIVSMDRKFNVKLETEKFVINDEEVLSGFSAESTGLFLTMLKKDGSYVRVYCISPTALKEIDKLSGEEVRVDSVRSKKCEEGRFYVEAEYDYGQLQIRTDKDAPDGVFAVDENVEKAVENMRLTIGQFFSLYSRYVIWYIASLLIWLVVLSILIRLLSGRNRMFYLVVVVEVVLALITAIGIAAVMSQWLQARKTEHSRFAVISMLALSDETDIRNVSTFGEPDFYDTEIYQNIKRRMVDFIRRDGNSDIFYDVMYERLADGVVVASASGRNLEKLTSIYGDECKNLDYLIYRGYRFATQDIVLEGQTYRVVAVAEGIGATNYSMIGLINDTTLDANVWVDNRGLLVLFILFFAVGSAIVMLVWYLQTRDFMQLERALSDTALGRKINNRPTVISRDLKEMWDSIIELNKRVEELQYSKLRILEAYYRFAPKNIEKVLSRNSIVEVKNGENVETSGTIAMLGINSNNTGDIAKLNSVIADIGLYHKEHGIILVGKAPDMTRIQLMFLDNEIGTVDFFTQMFNNNQKSRDAINFSTVLYHDECQFGIIGTDDEASTYLYSDNKVLAEQISQLITSLNLGLVITEEIMTREKITGPTRFIGYMGQKKNGQKIKLYEILDACPVAIRKQKIATMKKFRDALNQYYEKDFYLSRTSFSEILKDAPDDKLVKWYVFESDRYLNEFANDEDYMNLHV